MADKPQHPPTIELDGVRLRPLRPADVDALYAYLRDPAVTELTAYPDITASLVETIIERSQSRWAAGELSKWGVALVHDDRLVGTCGFNEWSAVHRWAELAYDLGQAHWGKGLMRQAVAAVLQWAFQKDQVDRVHAYVRVDNSRSQRLLERSGFLREGCLRSYRVCRGLPHDFSIYGLLALGLSAPLIVQPLGGEMMAWFKRIALLLAVCLAPVALALAEEPPGKPKVKIEFRWAEEKAIEGLTEARGIDLSCTDKKAFLHKEAFLSNKDIAEAHIRKANAALVDKFIIEAHLTKDAGKKMAKSSGENLKKPLVVMVDGKVAAAMVVMDKLSDVVPITGYFTEAEAQRIIKGIK